eukprot:Ihof_evm1s335 gene=Ihof_evmTU1s335
MKLFDNIQYAPSDKEKRTSVGSVNMESLRRRARKRAQLWYRKVQAESFPRLLIKLVSMVGVVLLVIILCHRIQAVLHSSAKPYYVIPPREVSIVIPTYHENENIPNLVKGIFEATKASNIATELVLVDDNSNDGIVETVLGLQKQYDLTLVVRKKAKGLSSAVMAGFSHTKYDVMLVMDADLSHPPEFIPAVLAPIFKGEAEFSLASRYVAGGRTQHWPMSRKIISWGASQLARPLTSVNDPMSGFFGITKRLVNKAENINTLGFKIGLELIVKAQPVRLVEVPYVFIDR